MKKVLIFAGLIGLSACEFYYYDPYNPGYRVEGRYSVNEYSETYTEYYNYTIWVESSNRSVNEIRIVNFYGADVRVYATVNYNKITIHRQTVNGYTVEGTGTIYGDEISFNYSVRNTWSNSRTDFCEATAWKN